MNVKTWKVAALLACGGFVLQLGGCLGSIILTLGQQLLSGALSSVLSGVLTGLGDGTDTGTTG